MLSVFHSAPFQCLARKMICPMCSAECATWRLIACSTVCGSQRMVIVRPRSSGLSPCTVSSSSCQYFSQAAMISSREASEATMNSWSRLRSGFSPSVVKKSVKRERMLPAMCFTITATLLDSASSAAKNCSSLSCSMAVSAWRRIPRRLRKASSRYMAPRSDMWTP